MPIAPGMAVFPGDPPVSVVPTHAIRSGDPYNVSALRLGSHTGTHVDPPRHFFPRGRGVDRLDLEALFGPCWVAEIGPRVRRIEPDDIERLPEGVERVLFRTRNSNRWARSPNFFPEYVALSPEGAAALAERRVRLVGLDALSIERSSDGRFPVHRTLLGQGIVILEGLRLEPARRGPATLACFPLRLVDGDGGPCRALLGSPLPS